MSRYWLVKQEPSAYSWADFLADGRTAWTGVQEFQARNNLRTMRRHDLVLYYHSVTNPSVMGVAKEVTEAYPDPTAADGDWSCVDLAPVESPATSVSLSSIKAVKSLAGMALLRQSRLSVMPVTEKEYGLIVKMGSS